MSHSGKLRVVQTCRSEASCPFCYAELTFIYFDKEFGETQYLCSGCGFITNTNNINNEKNRIDHHDPEDTYAESAIL